MGSNHFRSQYMKKHIVYRCPECGGSTYVEDNKPVAILDIHEDDDGEDVVTYKCPDCDEIVKSKRYMYCGGR